MEPQDGSLIINDFCESQEQLCQFSPESSLLIPRISTPKTRTRPTSASSRERSRRNPKSKGSSSRSDPHPIPFKAP
ncbi:hypothetical protein J5N97_029352 [Dioscorea zingiberensis]|uniref:Uncharacterized protein n=1 Tax=Dioscorea zingiberensis TaxID=325984 RepID=A0A9D5H5T4_9LILI|nr:hypothetical protein J5N97_029352 [Dioscorea zingiberensis]